MALPPSPASVAPSTGQQGATIATFTVTGTSFDSGGTSTLSFSGTGITVNSYSVQNATTLTASITIAGGAAQGPRNVIVTNADTQTGTLAAAFTVAAPPSRAYVTAPPTAFTDTAFSAVVQSFDNYDVLSPVLVDTHILLTVFVGSGFLSGTVTGTILAGQSAVTISGVKYNVSEAGVILFATSTSGDSLAHFTNWRTTDFTEVVSSVSPSAGSVGSFVNLVGLGFGNTQGTSTVTCNGILVTTIISWSDTLIVVALPTGATSGDVIVVVNGESSAPVPFTVTAATRMPFICYVSTSVYRRTRVTTTTGSNENK